MTGLSKFIIASIRSLPKPGHAKIVSVTVAKAMSVPNSIAKTVIIGIRILGKRCAQIILIELRPRALANLIKSSDMISTVPDLASRITIASLKKARLVAGSIKWRRPSKLKMLLSIPKKIAVSPLPETGNQPRRTEKTIININPSQKVGIEIPRIELPMIIRVLMLFG